MHLVGYYTPLAHMAPIWACPRVFTLSSIHQIKLITVFFIKSYLSYVSSPFMRTSEALVMLRSRQFNLKLDEERHMALKAIVSLLQYLKSRDFRLHLLSVASSEASKQTERTAHFLPAVLLYTRQSIYLGKVGIGVCGTK